MLAQFGATVVALFHGALVISFVVCTLLAIVGRLHKITAVAAVYYGTLAIMVASDRILGECVLTRWERELRESARAGSGYRGAFIAHYFSCLPSYIHHWIGPALVVAAVAACPIWIWIDRRRARRLPPQPQ